MNNCRFVKYYYDSYPECYTIILYIDDRKRWEVWIDDYEMYTHQAFREVKEEFLSVGFKLLVSDEDGPNFNTDEWGVEEIKVC